MPRTAMSLIAACSIAVCLACSDAAVTEPEVSTPDPGWNAVGYGVGYPSERDIAFQLSVPCANGGRGEPVQLQGTIRTPHIFHNFYAGDGEHLVLKHTQITTASGRGLVTGDRYHYVESSVHKIRYGGKSSNNNRLGRIVLLGPGVKLTVEFDFKVSVGAHGELIVIIRKPRVSSCETRRGA